MNFAALGMCVESVRSIVSNIVARSEYIAECAGKWVEKWIFSEFVVLILWIDGAKSSMTPC